MPNVVTEAFALTSFDGVFLSVDDAFCDIIQRERRDILGQTIIGLTIASDREANTAKLAKLRLTGEPFVIRKHYLGSDNAAIGVENAVSVLTEADHRPSLIASVKKVSAATAPTPADLLAVARAIAGEQLLRTDRWREAWASGSSWTMIVNAYIREAEGRTVSVDDLLPRHFPSRSEMMQQLQRLIDGDIMELENDDSDIRSCVRLTKSFVTELEDHLRTLLG